MYENGLEVPPMSPADFDVFGWPWTGFVTLFTLLVYFAVTFQVGQARRKYKVPAPEMHGAAEFMRVVRVQMNTLEQMVIFLPLLWMAALCSHDGIAAGIGVLWPVSRILYAVGYYKAAEKRHIGFLLGFLVVLVLFGLVAVQLVRSLLVWQS